MRGGYDVGWVGILGPHVHPGRRNGCAHLRRHRGGVGDQRRLGREGTGREGPADARARARPRREASRLSDGDAGELAVRRPQSAVSRGQREAGEAGPDRIHHASGVGPLVRQRPGEPVLGGAALRLDARLPRRRPLAALGPPVLPVERPRLRGQREGRLRRRLADPLRGRSPPGTSTSSASPASAGRGTGCRSCPTASTCRRWR